MLLARTALCLLLPAAVVAACDDSGGNADGGAGPADSGVAPAMDAEVADAGRADMGIRDVGIRDATVPDASAFCAVNDRIAVGQTQVQVGSASMPARSPSGSAASTGCIDRRPTMGEFAVTLYLSGCLNIVGGGGAPTQGELNALEMSIFPEKDALGEKVDPSYDFVTGADRAPNERLELPLVIDTQVAPAVCASGMQYTLGFDVPASNALFSETFYVVRTRTATGAAAVWMTQYHTGIIARNDQVRGAALDRCTTMSCFLRRNLSLVRTAVVTSLVQNAQMPVPGGANLGDGRGTGYALVEANDCGDAPVHYAVAGFSPEPLNKGYFLSSGFDPLATESDPLGLFAAIGFPGQSATSSAALPVTAAVGLSSTGACTEEFGGGVIDVYPDSITAFRSGRETTLHGN